MEKSFPMHIVAVDGIIENNDNILLAKNRYTGTYTFVGGQVDVGEGLTQALIREALEETGLDIRVEKLIYIASNTSVNKGYNGVEAVPTKVIFGFICKYIGGELRTSDETEEVFWVEKSTVLDYITRADLVERFKAYLEVGGQVKYLQYATSPKYALEEKRNI